MGERRERERMIFKVEGCGNCPFRVWYRSNHECCFKMGVTVRRMTGYYGEYCPLLTEDIVIQKAKDDENPTV